MADDANKPADSGDTQDQAADTPVEDGFEDQDVKPTESDTSSDSDTGDSDTEGDAGDAQDEADTESKTEDKDESKKSNEKHYYERQLKKKDEAIAQLQKQLDGWTAEGENEIEQRVRGMEAREYMANVQKARNDLVLGNQRAQSEIPIFNPDSPEYNKELHDKVMANYSRDAIITEQIALEDGKVSDEIVGYRVPIYDYLKDAADMISGAKKAGAKQGQKAEAKMRAKAEVPGSKSKTGKSDDDDPFLKGFNSY